MRLLHAPKSLLMAALLFSTSVIAETIWIDVRSPGEYQADHIPGDLNIPHTLLPVKITDVASNKSTEIRLYCRSGNRAGIAKSALEQLGYTRVSNTGSINETRALRGLN